VTKGGYEYNVILIAAVIALTEVGPGPLSLDHALGRERTGSGWALAALLTGVGGAIGAHVLSEAAAEAEAEAMAAPAAAPDQEPTEAQRGPAPVAA
jgi:putative oxidoreductase